MKRVLIACGGTGGHLAPGIALAEELLARGWECELLISGKKVDSRLVQKYKQFKFEAIAGSGLSFQPARLIRFLRDLVAGYRRCVQKIKSIQPNAVIGFGGFISASALLAGARHGIPVAIHEANQVPGRVTRLVGLFADRVYLPFGVDLAKSKNNRIHHVGMPLRAEFERLPKKVAKRSLGFDPSRKLLLVFGGSQGARSLNEWAKNSSIDLANDDIQLLCLTGGSGDSVKSEHVNKKTGVGVSSAFIGFSDQMATLLSAADMAVSRAGAGSVAELIRCRVPSVLVPYPYAADNHQYFNAKRFEEQGGGICLQHDKMSDLYRLVIEHITDEQKLRQFVSNMETMDHLNAQGEIANDLERIVSVAREGLKKELSIS